MKTSVPLAPQKQPLAPPLNALHMKNVRPKKARYGLVGVVRRYLCGAGYVTMEATCDAF